MEAAFTVMAIFTLSTIIVRIASTIMRLTGLPDNVARFQSLSAMTGTGFTTRESELIVNYPIRRRVLMTLMIIGNLGLVSVVSTFVVTFSAMGPDRSSILQQALAAGGTRPVHLLYGARQQANLYALDQIEALRNRWQAPFTFTPALSEEDLGSDWAGARGLITEQIAGITNLLAHEAYLCGPPAMIDQAEARLIAAGFERSAISADRFLDRGSRG